MPKQLIRCGTSAIDREHACTLYCRSPCSRHSSAPAAFGPLSLLGKAPSASVPPICGLLWSASRVRVCLARLSPGQSQRSTTLQGTRQSETQSIKLRVSCVSTIPLRHLSFLNHDSTKLTGQVASEGG